MGRRLVVDVWVPGNPVPQGSMTPYINKTTGRPGARHKAGKRLEAWRNDIGWRSLEAMMKRGEREIAGGVPLELGLVFLCKSEATDPPDLDKLVRGVKDALTGVVYKDDAQVVSINAEKRRANAGTVGAQIQVLVLA